MAERETIVHWDDGSGMEPGTEELSGLEFMRKVVSGELPESPMGAHAALHVVSADAGEVSVRCTPDESHFNRIGSVHGGLMCTLLDSALGGAVHTTVPAGTGFTSIDINVSYLRAVFPENAPLVCNARVTKPGRRVVFAEGEVIDARGKTVATATSTFLVFALEDGPRRGA